MVEKKAAERRQAEEKVELIFWNRLLRGTIELLFILMSFQINKCNKLTILNGAVGS